MNSERGNTLYVFFLVSIAFSLKKLSINENEQLSTKRVNDYNEAMLNEKEIKENFLAAVCEELSE